jgi:serine/threonine protein kinase
MTPKRVREKFGGLKMIHDIEVGRKIGAGSFGDVYFGTWQDTTEIALKMLKGGPEQVREFAAEARTLQKLDHPRIVRFFGVYSRDPAKSGAKSGSSDSSDSSSSDDDSDDNGELEFFMVTEFMKGGAVNSLLQSKGEKLSSSQLVRMTVDTAAGMRYLESVGMIHRE